MKKNRSLVETSVIFLVASIFLFSACNKDNNDNEKTAISNNNSNQNFPNPYTHRLEFPKIRGGKSIIITHIDQSTNEVNYSLEWDGEKKSNRWTCYQIYNSNSIWNTGRWYGNPQYPADPLISSSMTFGYDPYWGTGYDHGHLCPSADRRSTEEAQRQTFYLVVP